MPFQPEGTLDDCAVHENGNRAYRYRVPSLVYVNLDQGNGGIVRDITANGMGIQAVGHLRAGQSVLTRFDLLNPRTRVEASAEGVWANGSGQGGLPFSEVADPTRRGVNDWIFTNLLAGMEHATARTTMFQPLTQS